MCIDLGSLPRQDDCGSLHMMATQRCTVAMNYRSLLGVCASAKYKMAVGFTSSVVLIQYL